MSNEFIKEETNNSHGGLLALTTLECLPPSQRDIFNIFAQGYGFQNYYLENDQELELNRESDALEFSHLIITQRENTQLDFLFNFYHKSEIGTKSIIFQLPSKLISSENIRIEKNFNNQGYWDYHIKFPWKMFFDESLKYVGVATQNHQNIFRTHLCVKIKSRAKVFSVHFGVREIYVNSEERREIISSDYFLKYRYFHYLTVKKNGSVAQSVDSTNNINLITVKTKSGLSGLTHGFFIYCRQWKTKLKKLSMHVLNQHFFTIGCYDIINLGKIISDDVFYFPFDFKSSYGESKHGCINLSDCDDIYITLTTRYNPNENSKDTKDNNVSEDIEIYILADDRLEWKVNKNFGEKIIKKQFGYCFERELTYPVLF